MKLTGYNCYPGFGWRAYGRLIINFAHGRATTVFYNGELIWERGAL
jgi:hypothetical protein